jgi:thiol-disulfide isomerase/thioredoxin
MKFFKKLFWIAVIAIVVYAVYLTYNDIIKNLPSKPKEGFDNPSIKISLFHAEWCPHCVNYLKSNVFMSTYDKLKSNPKYSSVVFEEIDYDQNKDLAEKYGINSFPTIVAISSDGHLLKKFSGDRSSRADLTSFVDEILKSV